MRSRPPRVVVKAPDTSKFHDSPRASTAVKLMVSPSWAMRAFFLTMVKPAATRTRSAMPWAALPSWLARAWKSSKVSTGGTTPGGRRRCGRRRRARRRSGRLGQAPGLDGGHPGPGDLEVVRIEVVAHVATARARRRDHRGARAEERVEHDVAPVGVEVDQPLGQLDGERGRVADPAGALGRDLPHVEGRLHELVVAGGVLRRQGALGSLLLRHRPIEATLAGDDHALGEIAQRRVAGLGRRCPTRTNRWRPGSSAR